MLRGWHGNAGGFAGVGGSGFGGVAAQGGGWGSQQQQSSSGFGQAAPGFGGFSQSGKACKCEVFDHMAAIAISFSHFYKLHLLLAGGGFGGFGGASGGGFGSLSTQTPARPSGGGKMWEMRK